MKSTVQILVIAIVNLIIGSCGIGDKDSIGEALSKKYCTSCHAYPEPSLLPKEVWNNSILPVMAAFADLHQNRYGKYQRMSAQQLQYRDPIIENIRASISGEDYNKIAAFYLENAPDKLSVSKSRIEVVRDQFFLRKTTKKAKSFTTCIYFDQQNKLLFQSNLTDNVLNIYNEQLQLKAILDSCKGVVDVRLLGENNDGFCYLVTHIGTFQPSVSSKNGFIERITLRGDQVTSRKKLCDGLYRPVQALVVDIDKDGNDDIVVAEFGFMSGQVSLFRNSGRNEYVKTILSNTPGAVKMLIDDINVDGLPDVWVLFAHDIEGIFQFINSGNGNFEQRRILSFPPSYGSTYFEFADFDNDGKKDILYTCGDNADYSPVLKPYHGVYIFRNTGGQYAQVYFKHLNGCYKAVPADFNGDGKIDLATISFFADYEHNPKEAFTCLLNDGNWTFQIQTESSLIDIGRWICMDVKDFNNDGKPDIVLGNMAAKFGDNTELMRKWLEGPEFLVLQNQLK